MRLAICRKPSLNDSSQTSRFGDLGIINLGRVRLLSRAKAVAFLILMWRRKMLTEGYFLHQEKKIGSRGKTWKRIPSSPFSRGRAPHHQTCTLRFCLLVISTLVSTYIHFLHLTSFPFPPWKCPSVSPVHLTSVTKIVGHLLNFRQEFKKINKAKWHSSF